MTDPDTRCSVAGCEQPSELLDLYHGRRCHVHRARYSPTVAAVLAERGWVDTLAAYRRSFRRSA